MDASSYTADSGGKASLEFLFVKDQERNRFAFDPVKKRLKFSPKVQALFNALEVAVRAEYLDRLIKSSNMLSSFKKYSTVAELKEALPGRFMTIQDFVKTKARWVRGGYSLGLSKGYHLYFGWSRLCGLIDWMTAYALELIGFVEPGHTDAFLSQITRDNKLIVFFVPDGMWDSGVTRDEMNWIAEKLQSKPDAFNILFVFGAYDTYFSPADLQVYTQKGKEAFDDLMATRVREDLGSGMSDEEREKLEEDINSNIKEYEERRKKAYKMRELENELRNLPWSVVLRDATSRLRDAVFKSKKPKAGKAGEPSADSRPEASDSRPETRSEARASDERSMAPNFFSRGWSRFVMEEWEKRKSDLTSPISEDGTTLNVDGIYLVHLTDTFPTDGYIHPTSFYPETIRTPDGEIKQPTPWETVHFSLNSTVAGTLKEEYANAFLKSKYVILIPLKSVSSQLAVIDPMDSVIIGSLKLPPGAVIAGRDAFLPKDRAVSEGVELRRISDDATENMSDVAEILLARDVIPMILFKKSRKVTLCLHGLGEAGLILTAVT